MAEQSGQNVIFFGVKGFLIYDLINDLEVEVGDEQVRIDVQKIPDVPLPEVHIFF